MGDLNVIGAVWEKYGGREVQPAKIRELQDFLADSSLMDIGFKGNVFTWINKRFDGVLVKERIDRVLANVEWLNSFPNTEVIHELFHRSDSFDFRRPSL